MKSSRVGAALWLVALGHDARASTLVDLATKVAVDAKAAENGALVVVAPIVSDVPLTRGPELATRLAQVVAGRLGPRARAEARALPLAAARGAAGRAGGLLYLEPRIRKGVLAVTADLYPPTRNPWERIRNPLPSPTAHGFAEGRIDAEIRAFLPPITLDAAKVTKAKLPGEPPLALGCIDFGSERGVQIVVVARSSVSIGRIVGGRFEASASIPWSSLAPRVPVPLRDPVGWVFPAATGAWVVSSDRGSVLATAALDALATSPLLLVDDGTTCVRAAPGDGGVDLAPVSCAAPPAGAGTRAAPGRWKADALALGGVSRPDGRTLSARAFRDTMGTLHLALDGVETEGPVTAAGATLAVGDLDLDGSLDVVTSTDEPSDAIVVLAAEGERKEKRRVPAPGGVHALAVCPPEEASAPALVAGVGDEVWLIR